MQARHLMEKMEKDQGMFYNKQGVITCNKRIKKKKNSYMI